MKTLRVSQYDRKLLGVCGGIAEYFKVDSTLIRIIMILFAMTGSGLLAYPLIAWIMGN